MQDADLVSVPAPAPEAPPSLLGNSTVPATPPLPPPGPLGMAPHSLDKGARAGKPSSKLLGGLAAAAALLVVAGLVVGVIVWHSKKTAPTVAKSSSSAAAPAMSAGAPAKSGAVAAAASSSAPAAHPAASAGHGSASREPSAATGETPLPAIQHAPAPTCTKLLVKEPARHDGLPGAAYRSIQNARRALVRGDIDAAERAYCRAADFDSGSVTAAVELTRVFLLRRDGKAAVAWAERARKRGADDALVHGLLGDGYALANEFDNARKEWLLANGGQPGDAAETAALARKSLVIARQSLAGKAYFRAERYFRRAAVLSTNGASAAVGMARALLYVDVPADALTWARYAVEKAPRSPDAQIVLGDVLHRKGQDADARKAWEKALKLQPGNPTAAARLKVLDKL